MKLTKTVGSIIFKGYNTCFLTFAARKFKYRGIHTYYNKNKLQNYAVNCNKKRYLYTDEDDELSDDGEDVYSVYTEFYQQSPRRTLEVDLNDILIRQLNNCSSLEDVLSFIINHETDLNVNHITQLVLMLWDAQKIFYHVSLSASTNYVDTSNFNKLNEDYISILKRDKLFDKLEHLLKSKRHSFSLEQLSFILLYLKKIGLSLKEEIMQLLILQFKHKFTRDISLFTLARFISAIYAKKDLSFYFNVQEFIPIILDNIDRCTTAEELYAVTTCLIHVNEIVMDDYLIKFKRKVIDLLASNKITYNDFKTILNILVLLNLQHWRSENVKLINECFLMLKDHLQLLNVNELSIIYEVFGSIQEPADILNEIQRCATKFLLQMEEDMSPLLNVRLRLFSCIVYFASPLQRPHFKKIIRQYIDYELDGKSLMELYRIILFTKISEIDVCNKFWRKVLSSLEDKNFRDTYLLKVCQNYIRFTENTEGCRSLEFEDAITKILEEDLEDGLTGLLPSRFATAASFLLIFAKSPETLNLVLKKVAELAEHFRPMECLHLSRCLYVAQNRNKYIKAHVVDNMRKMLDRSTYSILRKNCISVEMNMLLKSYIYRDSADKYLSEVLWSKSKKETILYSTLLKNVSYNLFMSNTLEPELINAMVDYIIESKSNILGFNAETIVHLCYQLGFLPTKSDEFFKTIIDIFLRDQERMSGLSYLQACLSLCFFNNLPHSFIKQIFTVEFMEKLDIELTNCYYEDVYPFRVRNYMMQLNRAVCLDYPHLNVPWFHKKYITQQQEKSTELDRALLLSIKECLNATIKGKQDVKENEISPYGYCIDFAINSGVAADTNGVIQKSAILIMKPSCFTNHLKQLRGYYQLKIRHLEILGYKVCLLNSADYQRLLFTEDKVAYLKMLLK